MGLVILWSFIK